MSELVLVTGISGFIGGHLALELLRSGYRVRGTVRSAVRADEVRATLARHGADPSGLSVAEADLTSDAGWREAAEGCDYVQHVASPFPIRQPRDREALVPEAVDGTLRVLKAAREAGVRRIVLTSSIVAMIYRARRPERFPVRETDWTDLGWSALTPYIVSKTRAERAAWKWARENGWEDRLTTVNPGFVLGPALDRRAGTSLEVVTMMLKGALPAVPPANFAVVDVRDLVRLHVAAMTAPGTPGRRLIAANDTLSFPEMARILRAAFPERARRIPTRTLPPALVRLLSHFDRSLKSVLPDLEAAPVPDVRYVTDLTGVTFRPGAEAIRAAGASVLEHGLV